METIKCELCGEPLPEGEEMFRYHGYSGPCPKPPLPSTTQDTIRNKVAEIIWRGQPAKPDGLEVAFAKADEILNLLAPTTKKRDSI